MNGRVYDPLTAQFFSPDPYLQAPGDWLNYNRYAYCLNNPFKYTDPDGEVIFTLICIFVPGMQIFLPAAIAADAAWMSNYISQVVTNYANGYKGTEAFFGQVDWFDVGASAVFGGASVYVPWIKYVQPWVTNAVDIKGNGDVVTIFGSNRNNPTKDFGMYLGGSFLETGSVLVTDILQGAADNNWGKGKPKNAPKSIEDMMQTSKGLKELNKMTTQDLWKKASNELWKESLWGLGREFMSSMSQSGFENQYLERQQQNPYPSYPYPGPYNQNMNYSPMPDKDMRKSKSTQYEMLIRALSLKQ
jgi:hypothetical protein